MLKTTLISLLTLAAQQASAAGSDVKAFAWPAGLSREAGRALMIENLGLLKPVIAVLDDGQPANDFLLRNDPGWKPNPKAETSGFWKVEGSVEEQAELFLVKGPATMRLEPDGKVAASWPDGIPVVLLKARGDWKLVMSARQTYLWIESQNLQPLAPDKLYLKPASALARGLPASALAGLDVRAKIAATRALLEKGECPSGLSEAERDRAVGKVLDSRAAQVLNEDLLQSLRRDAWLNCPEGKVPPPRAPQACAALKMKSKRCSCFVAIPMEGSSAAALDPGLWKTAATGTKCFALRFHFEAFDEPKGEGDLGRTTFCPKSCF